ncbi:MAG: MFS transporter [Bryobacteraceae bacterium]|nr:MFS transporter [Bryobacteraceae bacterium]
MTEDRLHYAGWRVAAGAAVGVFASFASVVVYTFGVFLKPVSLEFGWSRESVSMAFGIAALTVAACSPPLGMLLDRYGPLRTILPSVAVLGLSYASLAWLTPNLWHLYLVFFAIGVVGNGTAQMAYARAVSTWFVRRRGLALAVLMTGGAVGAMVLPGIAQSLIDAAGWRFAFLCLGIGVLAVGLPVAASTVRENPDRHRSAHGSADGTGVRCALGGRPFWLIAGALFLVSLGQNGAITHMHAILTDRGIDPSLAAAAVSVLGAASLAGRFGAGWLLDRFYAPRVSACLLVIAAGGVLLLSIATTPVHGLAAAALIGVGLGGEADVTPYLIARYFGLRSFSTLYGFTWTAYAIAGAVGPVLMGRSFDTSQSYGSLLIVLAGLSAAAASLMLFMPPYPQNRPSPAPTPLVTPERRQPPAAQSAH